MTAGYGSARERHWIRTGAVVLAAHFAAHPAVRVVSSGGNRIAVPV